MSFLMGNIYAKSLIKYPLEKDLYYLADQAAKSEKKPRIFMTCGTEDFLYESNTNLRDYLRTKPFDFKYEEWPGVHEWGFWDKSVQMMLEHFLIQ